MSYQSVDEDILNINREICFFGENSRIVGLFNWRSIYDANTLYNKNDVIKASASGSLYVYVSPTGATGTTLNDTSHWELMVDTLSTNIGANNTTATGPFPMEGDILRYNDQEQVWENAPGLWEDLTIPVTSTRRSGSNDPTFSRYKRTGTSQGVFISYFDQSVEEELYFTAQLSHAYKEGTNLMPHVHMVTDSNASGTVAWGLEYTWANVNGEYSDTTIIKGELYIPSNTGNKHYVVELGGQTGMDGTGKKISSMIIARIFRDVNGNDNYPDSIGLLEIDFHYQLYGFGSNREYLK